MATLFGVRIILYSIIQNKNLSPTGENLVYHPNPVSSPSMHNKPANSIHKSICQTLRNYVELVEGLIGHI